MVWAPVKVLAAASCGTFVVSTFTRDGAAAAAAGEVGAGRHARDGAGAGEKRTPRRCRSTAESLSRQQAVVSDRSSVPLVPPPIRPLPLAVMMPVIPPPPLPGVKTMSNSAVMAGLRWLPCCRTLAFTRTVADERHAVVGGPAQPGLHRCE
jgi:hypothetical protein